MRSRHISKRTCLIFSSSGRISTDWIENIDEPLLSMVNGNFLVCRRSGRLKIDFLASDPPIDPPFSGSGGKDPPPTVYSIRLAGSRAGLDGWVRSRFCLDTPTPSPHPGGGLNKKKKRKGRQVLATLATLYLAKAFRSTTECLRY